MVVTRNDLLPVGSRPNNYRILDSNSVMLDALVRRDGGLPIHGDIVPDQREIIRERLLRACSEADVVLVSGGSSVGQEDYAPRVVAELGELAVHGVAMRPSSPTGFGWVRGRPVVLLPGNPVSCLAAYDFFAGPLILGLPVAPLPGLTAVGGYHSRRKSVPSWVGWIPCEYAFARVR
jgi:molybdopterin molybdotransferase